ncbi:LysR family transcriptional regulator [Solihabitans fulvus]|uniref:LysR family transcriptional regulator n=1 Tax=Solihabitans fulvus TaxID=1892852 RepID=A0A5B2XR71_9PSEU|nr:LysR substrate-binding domain-containing protein [Solihabitans fulvus]KAA2265381.1 LysR family transcriptional regulator [Solihabitans fulvus]
MSELTLTGLRVVREIALTGSFTAAARLLGYTQPTISRQVAAMEAAAGAPLFVRAGRGVRLSPAGSVVVEHAGRILAGVETLRQDLAALDDRVAGRVALGAFPSATAVLAPLALARLRVDHPRLEVALTEGPTPTLLRQLRAGRLAVAVIGAGAGLPDYDLAGLDQQIVFAGGLCVAAPAGHRLAGAGSVSVAELTGETWIAGEGAGGEPQFGAWPTLTDPVIGHVVRGWPARLGLVAAGLGLCLVPEVAARSIPAGVVTVDVDDPSWLGRMVVALTAPAPGAEATAVVGALRRAGEDIRLRRDESAHQHG